jgi:BirA family biotin operon repressor/biotin-[acetyl-CoA-carboxylase] ligase
MAGLATAAAVKEITGATPDLRWPNDLLMARPARDKAMAEGTSQPERWNELVSPLERKFGGILIELNAEVTRIRYAVVGIGVNVNQEQFPDDLAEVATSLRLETGRCWPRVNLAAALLRSLDSEYRLLQLSPRARTQLLSRFEAASSYARGLEVEVDEDGGYTGITAGLDARGFLLVRTAGGNLRTVLSGGVRRISKS